MRRFPPKEVRSVHRSFSESLGKHGFNVKTARSKKEQKASHTRTVSEKVGKAFCMQHGAPQVALMVKNPPVNAGRCERWVLSLGCEDHLEEGTEAHSSILT